MKKLTVSEDVEREIVGYSIRSFYSIKGLTPTVPHSINIHEQIGQHEVTKIEQRPGMTTLTMTPLVIKTEDAEPIVKLLTPPKK